MNRTSTGLWVIVGLWTAAGAARAAYKATEVQDGGTLKGTVTWTGALPVPKMVTPATDKETCGAHPDESLVVDKDSKGVKNVLVTLVGVRAGKAFAGRKAELDQKGCVFTPRLLVVASKGQVAFKNSDDVGHNIHIYSKRNRAFNQMVPAGMKPVVKTFRRRERIKVTCDIHPWMRATIVVTDHPYVAVTDAKGRFNMADVPPGTYKVKVWYERGAELKFDKTVQEVTVEADQEAVVDFTLSRKE